MARPIVQRPVSGFDRAFVSVAGLQGAGRANVLAASCYVGQLTTQLYSLTNYQPVVQKALHFADTLGERMPGANLRSDEVGHMGLPTSVLQAATALLLLGDEPGAGHLRWFFGATVYAAIEAAADIKEAPGAFIAAHLATLGQEIAAAKVGASAALQHEAIALADAHRYGEQVATQAHTLDSMALAGLSALNYVAPESSFHEAAEIARDPANCLRAAFGRVRETLLRDIILPFECEGSKVRTDHIAVYLNETPNSTLSQNVLSAVAQHAELGRFRSFLQTEHTGPIMAAKKGPLQVRSTEA